MPALCTYKDVVLYPDDVTAAQIGRGERRNVQLLVAPVVRLARLDFAAVERGQLTGLRLNHSVPRHVLNRLSSKINYLVMKPPIINAICRHFITLNKVMVTLLK